VSLTWRYRLELILAAIAALMSVITLVWHDWIEIVFRIDPDHGGGWFEWLIVAALAAAVGLCGLLARADRRAIARLRAQHSPVI
jgi:hypothetical protein